MQIPVRFEIENRAVERAILKRGVVGIIQTR